MLFNLNLLYMKKIALLLAFFAIGLQVLMAQTKEISGRVTSADDGGVIPGVSVSVKGTTLGTITDMDGVFRLKVPQESKVLVFSFVGMTTQEVAINNQTNINVKLNSENINVDEVVVTALGIKREKKALGYAVSDVKGDISQAKESNFVNAISGKVSGVQIKQASTMGGSTNILIRGNKSLTGSNQAMFVIDGVPLDNSISNSTNVANGSGGYDYGNAASDINSEDIESISILKGAAATALYGSRAANGVVLITTKKGTAKHKGIGLNINSGVLFTTADKKTLPSIQKEYGGGYGAYYEDPTGYFNYADLNGDGTDDLIVPTSEDASWGAKFDKNLMVIDWVGLDPLDKTNYLRKVPWTAGKHDIRDFFETGLKLSNNVSLDGGNDNGTFRLSYTNLSEGGIMPNSKMKKNSLNFSGSYKFTPKISFDANVIYTNDDNKGRYGTGYDPGNPMQSMGQWFQSNVDIYDLKKYYKSADGTQRTWNYSYYDDLTPIFHNNIYWTRRVNYETDGRNRIFGYVNGKYQLLKWLALEGRASTDFYSELQEERIEVGSNQTSQYQKYLRTFKETNYDIMLRSNNTFGEFTSNALLGISRRRTEANSTYSTTVGGFQVPGFFNLMNSKSPISTTESDQFVGVNSAYGSLSLGYKNMLYMDITGRADKSSTLPSGNNTYFYPSVSSSWIISELPALKESKTISFAKVRLNYAQVGSGAPAYSIYPTYSKSANWDALGVFYVPTTLNNKDLKPEKTKSWEAGLEARFFKDRAGFDFSVYKTNTVDQIMPVSISRASGYNRQYVNAGEVENKGIELTLTGSPIKTKAFTWDINLNWTKNVNKVVDLYEGVNNILLSSAWDVSTNIVKGMSYGQLRGTNFVYTNGKRTVDADGNYLYQTNSDGSTTTDALLGSVMPNWTAGFSNTFTYKGLSLYVLVDISKGGHVYSVDQKYGVATGLFAETAGLNDKGKPKRDAVEDGGGVKYDAVYADGKPNTSYIWAGDWYGAWLYDNIPTAAYVYDASYVKLREVALNYSLPSKIVGKTPFTKISASLVGRNLWIIHKNTPYFDPETNMSAGNIQGIADGAYPSVRTIGFNISFGL
jgi:TonB-linked outer membrane protein, SusC/RagA family